jgi:hypothetical protein
MNPAAPPAASDPAPLVPKPTPSFTVQLYRFFFYRWLFRDARAGNLFEQAAALDHNRTQGKWLPLYMVRWMVMGSVIALLEFASERLAGHAALTAALAIGMVLVVMYLLVTGLCWMLLSIVPRRG